MSRYGVKYKPGGAIPKDVGLTIKMVKEPEVAAPLKKVIACESPQLMAVWLEPNGTYLTHIEVQDNNSDLYYPDIPVVATLVNADWETAGLASPLCIDGSAVTWDVTFSPLCITVTYDETSYVSCGEERHASVGLALGVTMGVFPKNQPQADGEYGTLSATPSYKGVPLNTITATVWLVGW